MKSRNFKWASPLFIIFLALAGVFSVTGALVTKQAEETPVVEKADAATTYAGSIGIQFEGWYWNKDNAKIAVYCWNGSSNGWTSMVNGSNDGSYTMTLSYSFSFDPFGGGMKIVRFNSSHGSTPDWSNIWNQTGDLSFGQVAAVNTGNSTATVYDQSSTYMHFNGFEWEDKVYNRLSYTQRNGSGHWEYYNTSLTFQQIDYGGVKHSGGTFYSAIHDVDSTYVYVDYGNTTVKYYGTGYGVYFDTNDKNSYYSIPDRAVAEHWGESFLSTITCTGTSPGAVTSADDAWNKTMYNSYQAMSEDQQGEVWTATANPEGTFLEKAVNRYDFIIRKYGTSKYSNFVNRNPGSGSAIRSFSPLGFLGDSEDGFSTLIIIVASSVALLSVTALSILVIKKRKRKEQ